MSVVRALLEVARQTARLMLQSRMFWVMVLAELGVAGIAFAIGMSEPENLSGRQLVALVTWWLLAFVLVPWTTLYFGVQAVHGDIEDRTFQYLFVRPVPRWAILVGKWLAVASVTAVVHSAGALLVHGAVRLYPDMWSDGADLDLLWVFVAAMGLLSGAYAAVACFFGARFRWPLVWGAGFIVGGQMLLANLPAKASIRFATITDPVRRFVLEGLDPDRRLARMLWPSEREWREELIGSPLTNLAILTGVAMLLALVSYSRSEYDSRTRE